MWDQNLSLEAYYHPPMSPEQIAMAHFGSFEGTAVDAYVGAMGSNAGFTVGWPTKVANAEFIADRLDGDCRAGGAHLWRHAENVRQAWNAGIDPEATKRAEARRIGVDFWFRLAMNDWHHLGGSVNEMAEDEIPPGNLWSAEFFSKHPEFLIGDDGARGWPKPLANVLRFLQDFAHAQVRALRRDLAIEACERYDVDGFLFDFMRNPGYFKKGEEDLGAPLMSGLIAETRAALDRIGSERERPIGFATRVPSTIRGSERLGLDVRGWVGDGLIDIIVPSCLFGQDTEEDIDEWVDLVAGTDTLLYPAIEEGYLPGHTGSLQRWYLKPPIMTPMSVEMIRAIAARHLAKGADGLYVFNFFGTAATYDYDNREALDDIGSALRLKHKDKTYVVTRSLDSWEAPSAVWAFPNCLETERQIPVSLSSDPVNIEIEILDDLEAARPRLEAVQLRLHLKNLTVYDEVEVSLNDHALACANPIEPGTYAVHPKTPWFCYDLMDHLPVSGRNRVTVRLARRNERLADEFAVTVEDVELQIRFEYPDGRWHTGGET